MEQASKRTEADFSQEGPGSSPSSKNLDNAVPVTQKLCISAWGYLKPSSWNHLSCISPAASMPMLALPHTEQMGKWGKLKDWGIVGCTLVPHCSNSSRKVRQSHPEAVVMVLCCLNPWSIFSSLATGKADVYSQANLPSHFSKVPLVTENGWSVTSHGS